MIPLRLILDVVFCGLVVLSFYMWAYLNDKYRTVKDDRDVLKSNYERLLKISPIFSSRNPTDKDKAVFWQIWIKDYTDNKNPKLFINLSYDENKSNWVEYEPVCQDKLRLEQLQVLIVAYKRDLWKKRMKP